MNQNFSSPSPFTPENKVKQKPFIVEILQFLFLAAVIVVPIRLFVAQPFFVVGSSMDPTFANRQYLIVNQIGYILGKPDRGDVAIIKPPREPGEKRVFFIKRVIGLPGETIKMEGRKVTIYNDDFPGGFELDEDYVRFHSNNNLERKIGENEYFMLGDNRADSLDSRVLGNIDKKNVVGKVFLRITPLDKLGLLPGHVDFEY